MRKIALLFAVLLCSTVAVFAQVTIKGKVTDSKDGTPINGATVKVRGENSSTTSNADGTFQVNSKLKVVVLDVSEVGHFSTSVKYAGNGDVEVKLLQDSKGLSEVVVTGVGVATTRKKLGISVESISADKLPPAPTASIDQALVGKIPGAQISSIDGTPGARTNILLRGINTINGGTQPIILLDGVQINTDISQVDLNSIDKIEVVQGAAASTIYGAQGANGVIQLFSKKGRQGKLNINFSTSTSFNSYINSGNLSKAKFHSFATNASGKLDDGAGGDLEIDVDGTTSVSWAFGSTGWPSAMGNPNNIANKSYIPNAKGDFGYHDHFAQIFKTSKNTNANLNISGASDKTDFSFSLANNNQESNVRGNGGVNRTNLTSNVGMELFKGFRLRSITQLVYTKNTLMPFYQQGRNNMFNMLNVSPFFDLNRRQDDGTFPAYLYGGPVSVNGFNFNNDVDYTSNVQNDVDIIQNIQANFKVNKYFDLEAKYGINYSDSKATWIFKNQEENLNSMNWGPQNAAWNFNDADNKGEINKYTNNNLFQNFLATAYLKFDLEKELNLKFPITSSTQGTWDYRKNRLSVYNTHGLRLPISNLLLNMEKTEQQVVSSDAITEVTTWGYLVNQKFDFGDYGGISGGFRTDYNTASSKTATFPRADGYIRPSSFGFWKSSGLNNLISEWKVRAAYGEAGIPPGAYDRVPVPRASNLGTSLVYSSPRIILDRGITFEKSKELEIGTDVTLTISKKGNWFNNLNFSLVYWDRKSNNVIYDVPIVPSGGGTLARRNAIELGSNGLQFSLNTMVLNTKKFKWDFTTNWSQQVSKVLSIDGPSIPLTFGGGSVGLVLEAGTRIGQIFGKKAFTSFDERRKDGTPYIDKADYGKYEMVNGYIVDTLYKGIQFTNENYAFGDPNPKFNASFINSFTYKDFLSFGFQLDWVYGSHLYNQTKEWMYRDGIHSDYDNPVTIAGRTGAYTAFYRSAYADMFGSRNGDRNSTKDYFYEDASFARLRNVNIAIDFAKLFNMKAFSKLQLIFSGRNIFTITKYTGFDPEVSSGSVNSSLERGVDHNSMPNIKSYQIGLNVGF